MSLRVLSVNMNIAIAFGVETRWRKTTSCRADWQIGEARDVGRDPPQCTPGPGKRTSPDTSPPFVAGDTMARQRSSTCTRIPLKTPWFGW